MQCLLKKLNWSQAKARVIIYILIVFLGHDQLWNLNKSPSLCA